MKVSAAVPDCDVLLLQGEITTAASARAAHTVRAGGGLVVLNPAPVHDISAEMVAAADVIVPNEVEARALVPGGKALNGPALAAALHQPGRTAVVTLGARGAAWHADSDHGFVAPPAITAVDATAAGDSRPWRCGSPRAPATRRRCGSPARPGHMRQGCLGLSRACPLAQTSRPC